MRLPWQVPVPVRRSSFVPMYKEHRRYNIEVDLGAIGTFGAVEKELDDRDTLMCDLQNSPDTSYYGRFGAGRAGHYHGKYVKGVGRTSLAGNWANPGDLDQNTGFLEMRSAARELIVSAYLEAQGASDIINPCQGLLVRRIVPELRRYMARKMKAGRHPKSKADAALQAISLKDGDFVRLSNLVWLSNRLDLYRVSKQSTTKLAQLVRYLYAALTRTPATGNESPEDIAEAYFAAYDRGLQTLRRSFELGVSWRSLHNNFSADGRFLDLELPTIFGRPLIGTHLDAPQDALAIPAREGLLGLFEVFAYTLHTRMLTWHFWTKFNAIASFGFPIREEERAYAAALVAALDARAQSSVLWRSKQLVDLVVEWVTGAVDLSKRARAQLKKVLRDVAAVQLDGTATEATIPLVPQETSLSRVPHVIAGCGELAMSEAARFANEQLAVIDDTGDMDEMMVLLVDVVKKIKRYCRAQPTS